MRTTNVQLFNNFTMTQDGYSNPFDLELVTGYSIQAKWTGTPTGYLFIQVSDDVPNGDSAPTNWTLISRSIHPTGAVADDVLYKQHMATFRWIRLGYAFGSGSGTLNARLSCKGTT
jgi:hypothetical protein